MTLVSFVNSLWGILTIVANVIAVYLLVAQFSLGLRQSSFARFFRDHSFLVSFIASGLAMAGSLTYSDVIGYAPCVLCWFQSICMYPLVLIMGLAMFRKDQNIKI